MTIAVDAIKEAVKRGFRVTTNTTLFNDADAQSVRAFFDEMMKLGVEGMTLSPGYCYEKAPDQQHFLDRSQTTKLFADILSNRTKAWKFNQSPLFLEFLMGLRTYPCTPWGMPSYSLFGWQKPCYLLAGRIFRNVRGTAGKERMGPLRRRIGQSALRELHGSQRIRSQRRQRHVRITEELLGYDPRICKMIPDSGFRIPDSGFRIPADIWISDSGFRILDFGLQQPDSKLIWNFWNSCPENILSGIRNLESGIYSS